MKKTPVTYIGQRRYYIHIHIGVNGVTTVCVCKCLPHAGASHPKNRVDPEGAVNLNTVVGNGLFLGPGTLTGLGEGIALQ